MKVAVVGGGSTYTPELVDGFARLSLPVEELVLIDPATDRLAVIGPLGQRIFARYGNPGRVSWTSDLDAGLADAVMAALRRLSVLQTAVAATGVTDDAVLLGALDASLAMVRATLLGRRGPGVTA